MGWIFLPLSEVVGLATTPLSAWVSSSIEIQVILSGERGSATGTTANASVGCLYKMKTTNTLTRMPACRSQDMPTTENDQSSPGPPSLRGTDRSSRRSADETVADSARRANHLFA